MFSSSTASRLDASNAASGQTKSYDQLLAMRIALQKVLEVGNKLPGKDMLDAGKSDSDDVIEAHHKLTSSLDTTLHALTTLLVDQARGASPSSSSKKPRPLSWEEVVAPQTALRPKWEATLDKWNARLHFGSEAKQSKMKIFNHRIWEQIAVAMQDKQRCVEKSRMPLAESGRMDKDRVSHQQGAGDDQEDDDEDDEDAEEDVGLKAAHKKRPYDPEVYDDRALYALLLKAWIQSASQDAAGVRPEDLAALRKYRRSKVEVDRRASKGRKLRFVSHAKLQNFMFPVQQPEAPMDADRLFKSLFQ